MLSFLLSTFPKFCESTRLAKMRLQKFFECNNVCKVSVIKDNIWHVLFVILVLKLTSKTKAKGCYKIEYAGNNSQRNFLSNYISSTNKIEEYICIIIIYSL